MLISSFRNTVGIGHPDDLDLQATPTKTFLNSADRTPQILQPHPRNLLEGSRGDLKQAPNGQHVASQSAGTELAGTLGRSPQKRLSLITARAVKLSKAFNHCRSTNLNQYVFSLPPPSFESLSMDLKAMGLPSKIYQAPFYSRDEDISEQPKEYAGLLYRIKGGQGIATLEEWRTDEHSSETYHPCSTVQLESSGVGGWEYAHHPPSVKEVRRSLQASNGKLLNTKNLPSFKSQVIWLLEKFYHEN